MKTPRIDDFDPDARKTPVLKSTLDQMPVIEKPLSGNHVTPSSPVPPVPPTHRQKRVMKQRHPFDIYQDQYGALRELATEERKQGGMGSMSAMVREALDTLIAARKKK